MASLFGMDDEKEMLEAYMNGSIKQEEIFSWITGRVVRNLKSYLRSIIGSPDSPYEQMSVSQLAWTLCMDIDELDHKDFVWTMSGVELDEDDDDCDGADFDDEFANSYDGGE